jgi:hypothetical protein
MDRDLGEIGGSIGIGVNPSPADSLQEQEKQEGPRGPKGRFQPGKSGNPRGRSRGSRNRATLLAASLLDGQAQELVQQAIGLALAGDVVALRLCVERVLAPRRLERVQFAMPPLAKVEDAGKALAAIAAAVAKGDLAPAEAGDLAALVQSFVRAIEAHEFDLRLAEVEKASGVVPGGRRFHD